MNENSGLGCPLYPTLHKSYYWPYLSNLNHLQPASHPAKESTESWQIRQAENKGRLECRKRRHSLITFIVWKPHHRCLLQTSLLRSRVCYFCPFHSILFKGYTFFTTPLYGVFFGVCITLCHNESSAIYLQMTGQTLAEYPTQFLLCYSTTLEEFVFFFFQLEVNLHLHCDNSPLLSASGGLLVKCNVPRRWQSIYQDSNNRFWKKKNAVLLW